MEKQQFLDKIKELKSPANAELWAVLQLWLVEAKSDGEIAKALDKDCSTATRKIGEICKHFGTDAKGKKEQRQHLVLLFRKYCLDFEVHPNVYPEWIDGNLSDRPQPPTNLQNIPTIDTIPELTTLEFIGRDLDLTNLIKLRKQQKQDKIVLIKAGSGVGKSTLAREFLQTNFKKVIRLEMGLELGNVTPAEEKVAQILRKDFNEEPSQDFGINLDILREKLLDRANPIGVLIDNLEPALDENYRFQEKLRGYENLLRVLSERDVVSFTLITSRITLVAERVKVHEYLLEGLDITTWRQYFHNCENVETSEALMQMCVAYSGNAKVMDILHGAITTSFNGNIEAYWEQNKNAILANPDLKNLISTEMNRLRDNNTNAYKLLCRMGCYRYQTVKNIPFKGLICLLWDVVESRQSEAVGYLSKTSFIEIQEGEYYLHPAVREAAKLSLEENTRDWEQANREAAKFWGTRITKDIETIDQVNTAFEAYYHYLEIKDYNSACETLVKERESRWERAMVQGGRGGEQLGYSYVRVGGLLETITNAIEQVTKKADTQLILARAYNLEGDLLWLTGNPKKGITSHERTDDIISNISVDDHSVIERLRYSSMLNRGLCYLSLWEISIAHDFFLDLKRASLNGIEQYKYTDLGGYNLFRANFCLSVTFSLMDEHKNACLCIKQSIEGEAKNRVFSAWTRGYSLIFIAQAYKNIGCLEESKTKYTEAIDFADESKYSQVNAMALYGLGEIKRISYQYHEALSDIQQAEAILQKIGAKCDLAEAYFQLGLTYQAMGEHVKAEEYKAKALELFDQMEAPKQIDRVNKAFEQGAVK